MKDVNLTRTSFFNGKNSIRGGCIALKEVHGLIYMQSVWTKDCRSTERGGCVYLTSDYYEESFPFSQQCLTGEVMIRDSRFENCLGKFGAGGGFALECSRNV
eukprot:PhF_6_TR19273/c0_g1_i1/m.28336